MLTKGFKDEEQKKLDQLFNTGLQLEFVPDLWKSEQRRKVDNILQKTVNATLDDIENLSTEDMLQRLKAQNLNFSNYEHFADLLMKIIPVEESHRPSLARNAVTVYEAAQQESKTFSFGLIQKIADAKKLM